MRPFPLLPFAAALFALPAYAGNWVVNDATSHLTFTGTQAKEAFTGEFKRFIADITFDEAHLDQSHIQVTVDMRSATTDDHDRNDAIPGPDWFDVGTFPNAEFTSTHITKTAPHQFAAAGTLKLRGVSKAITLPFTLTPEGPHGVVAKGSVTLNRSDFHIGQGRWADDQWIAYPVTVSYVIHATQ